VRADGHGFVRTEDLETSRLVKPIAACIAFGLVSTTSAMSVDVRCARAAASQLSSAYSLAVGRTYMPIRCALCRVLGFGGELQRHGTDQVGPRERTKHDICLPIGNTGGAWDSNRRPISYVVDVSVQRLGARATSSISAR
jgi:hypothetical protein